MSEQPFYKGPALRVEQPLGTFFVISISADKLLEVCYSDKAEADKAREEAKAYFKIAIEKAKEDEAALKLVSEEAAKLK